MSNYIMSVKKKLEQNEYGNICDYLGIISVHDEFTMNIEDSKNINFGIINKIFEENNIVKVEEVIHENGKCIIKGSKMY